MLATDFDAVAGEAAFGVVTAALEDLGTVFTRRAFAALRANRTLATFGPTGAAGDVRALGFGHSQRAFALGEKRQSGGNFVQLAAIVLEFGDHIPEKAEIFAGDDLFDLVAELGDPTIGYRFARGQRLRGDFLPGRALDDLEHTDFTRCDEKDGGTSAPGSAGAANAVHVGFGVVGHVVVDDVGDARHVETTGGDIGGDDYIEAATLELFDHTLAKLLGHVAVECGCGVAARFEFVCEFDGGGLGAHEDDRRIEVVFDLENAGQGFELVTAIDLKVALVGCRHRAGGRTDLDFTWVAQVAVGYAADRVRHGGREQCSLPFSGRVLENPFDIVDEAHAQHFVGLVQHQCGEVFEDQAFALDVVDDAAGGADDDMGTALELAKLHDHALSAVKRQDVEAGQVVSVTLECFGDLNCEFACGGEHQHLRIVTRAVDAVQQRQREGGGLAGAGLGFTQNVVALHQRRDAGSLDGGGGFVTDLGERTQERFGETELLEGFDVRSHVMLETEKGEVTRDMRCKR